MTKTLLALAALSAASLSAATQTFSVSTSPNFDPGPTVSYSTLLNLPGFNNALGTLTAVNLYVETQMNQGGTWRNDGGNQTTYGYGYISILGNPAAQISVTGLAGQASAARAVSGAASAASSGASRSARRVM